MPVSGYYINEKDYFENAYKENKYLHQKIKKIESRTMPKIPEHKPSTSYLLTTARGSKSIQSWMRTTHAPSE